MIALKPRSLLQLTVYGFLTVALLLIVALILAGRQVSRLGATGQNMLSESVSGMQYVRIVSEQTGDMERNARQFQVTRDKRLLEIYTERRQSFLHAIEGLFAMPPDPEQFLLLNQLRELEAANYAAMANYVGQRGEDVSYVSILGLSRDIGEIQGRLAVEKLQQIQLEAEATQGFLRWQTSLLTLAAVALAALFVILITRPLRQIEKAINRLGSGHFTESIKVSGPADLARLGMSLDWLRQRFQELEKQRSSFFRHISHEFKTPLAAIHESGALLLEGLVGPVSDQQRKVLSIQSTNCQRLERMIDDLLKYQTEIQIGLRNMPHSIRLDKLIETVLASHQFGLESGRVHLETECVPVTIRADEEQVRVILDNLLGNAIKYSPAGGCVRITVLAQEGRAVFLIQDSGPGIPEDEQERIFEPFYKGSLSPRDGSSGHGLGLAIVREYLDMNGGQIALESTPSGSRFTVYFRLDKD